MSGRNKRRLSVVLVSACIIASLGLVEGPSAVASGGPSKFDPGINSAAALANPNCDATRKQLKFPLYTASQCVKPWPAGADNGGATEQGVTATSVKVVVLVADPLPRSGPNAVASGFTVNQATGNQFGSPIDATLDFNEVYKHVYETWGRTVDLEFVQATGSDEASQHADAVGIIAKKPFAVLDLAYLESGVGGGRIFEQAVQDKVPVVYPTVYTDPGLLYVNYAKNAAEVAGKLLVNGKAEYAGQDDMKTQKRSFAVVYEGRSSSTPGIDINVFNKEFAKYGGKAVVEIPYDPGNSADERGALAQQQAPTIAAKLKASGANNVIMFVDPRAMMPGLTKQMTGQEYFPEIMITSLGYEDIDAYARLQDQQQMAHAFGVGWFTPWVDGFTASDKAAFQWFWGKDKGTYSAGPYSLIAGVYAGIQRTGPKLTKKAFQAAILTVPPRGGAYSKAVTTLEVHALKPDQPVIRGFTLVWYNPNVTGPSQQIGLQGKGVFEFLDGGKRYVTGTLPKTKKKFFDESTSIFKLTTVPPGEVLPNYPCDNCPSSGGGPTPANKGQS